MKISSDQLNVQNEDFKRSLNCLKRRFQEISELSKTKISRDQLIVQNEDFKTTVNFSK